MRALLGLVCIVGIAGCGDGGNNNTDDAGTGNDLAVPSDLAAGPDLTAAGGSCDPLAQTGCTAGNKCALTIVGSGQNASLGTKCEPDGTAAVGAACTRTMGTLDSDCMGGGFCTRTGGASLTCHKLCGKDADCSSTEKCLGFTDTVGFCVPSCTPGGTGCAGGLDCSTPEPGIGSTQNTIKNPFWTCRVPTTDGGAPYTECMRSSDCAAGELCDQQNGWCAPLCDLNNDNCPQPPNQDGGAGNPGVSCLEIYPGLVPGACL